MTIDKFLKLSSKDLYKRFQYHNFYNIEDASYSPFFLDIPRKNIPRLPLETVRSLNTLKRNVIIKKKKVEAIVMSYGYMNGGQVTISTGFCDITFKYKRDGDLFEVNKYSFISGRTEEYYNEY